eukprot:8991345-Pyramimonas_sp.AAC.1
MASAAVSTTCSALLRPAGAQRETQSLRRSAQSQFYYGACCRAIPIQICHVIRVRQEDHTAVSSYVFLLPQDVPGYCVV